MKKLALKSFAFILAVSVLLSATGITVFQMACSKSKKVYVSLESFKTCCPTKKAECGFKKQCCDFSYKSVKLSQLSNPEFKTLNFAILGEIFSTVFSATIIDKPKETAYAFDSKAPPLSGRSLLNSISKFSI